MHRSPRTRRPSTALLATFAVVALALAACGSDDDSAGATDDTVFRRTPSSPTRPLRTKTLKPTTQKPTREPTTLHRLRPRRAP